MLKIGVLHPNPIPPPSAKQLIQEAKKQGHEPYYIRPQDLTIQYNKEKIIVMKKNKQLKLDIAFIRGITIHGSLEQYVWRMNIVAVLEQADTLTINNYKSILISRDKTLSPLILKKHGIPVPKTMITEDLNQALSTIEEWGKTIIKPIIGSLGRGIILVENPDTAYPILKQLLSWGQPLLLQEYIEKKENKDMRLLVINNQVYAAYYRIAREGYFKTNIAQGAIIEPAKPDEEAIELALKTTEVLGLFYGGIDVVEATNGKKYVLEANASPNWKGALKIGLNPPQKLINEAAKYLKR